MALRIWLLVAAIMMFLSGCAVTNQKPLELSDSVLQSGSGRLGVAMVALPKVDTEFPGAGCLLCYAFASSSNSKLTTHTHTLSNEDLQVLKTDLAGLIRAKGGNVTVIEDNINVEALPDYSAKGPDVAKKDFASLRQKYNVDKLLVIQIKAVGIWRSYSAYIPTGDPKAVVNGAGYIVNLSNNSYEWYMPVDVTKSADGTWDEPPSYPGLTNAYFQAVELAKDIFKKPFSSTQSQPLVSSVTATTTHP